MYRQVTPAQCWNICKVLVEHWGFLSVELKSSNFGKPMSKCDLYLNILFFFEDFTMDPNNWARHEDTSKDFQCSGLYICKCVLLVCFGRVMVEKTWVSKNSCVSTVPMTWIYSQYLPPNQLFSFLECLQFLYSGGDGLISCYDKETCKKAWCWFHNSWPFLQRVQTECTKSIVFTTIIATNESMVVVVVFPP